MNFIFWCKDLINRPYWVVFLGAAFAQLMGAISTPLLTHFYSPDSFGILIYSNTILSLLGVIIGGRYENAIIGEKDDQTADNLIFVVVFISFIGICLITILSIGFKYMLPLLYNSIFVPLLIGLIGYIISIACNNWLIRKGLFKESSALKIFRAVITLFLSLLLCVTYDGLVWSTNIGYLLIGLISILLCYKNGYLYRKLSLAEILILIKKFVKFPFQSLLPAFIDCLGVFIPFYFASSLYSTDDLGQWGLSRMLFALPMGLLASSISQVFIKRSHDLMVSNQSLKDLSTSLFLRVGILFLFLSLIVTFIGKYTFTIVLGDKWTQAGFYSTWLIWAYSINALCSMLSVIFIVLQKLIVNSIWQVMHCIVLYFFMSYYVPESFEHFIKYFVLIEIICYGIYGLLIYREIINHQKILGLNSQ